MTDWITIREASEISEYHQVYLRILMRSGKIKAQKFGAVWQVDRQSLVAFLRRIDKIGRKRGPKRVDRP